MSSAGLTLTSIAFGAGDSAVHQMQHPVRHATDHHVVCNHDGGRAQVGMHPGNRLEHQAAGLVIQGTGGLVAKQKFGPLDDGSRDRHPLLLAAR